jgi:hypothetical protein
MVPNGSRPCEAFRIVAAPTLGLADGHADTVSALDPHTDGRPEGGQIEKPIDHICRTCRGGQCRLLEGNQKLGVPTAAEGFEGEVGQDFTERHCVGAGQPRVTMRPFGRDVVAVEAAMVV